MKLPKIEKLPSGSFRAQIQIDGKRYSVTGASPKEVEREIAALKLKLKKAPQKASELTLTKAIDAYIEARKNVLSPSTVRGYRNIQNNRLQALMHKPVKFLTRDMCQRAVNDEAKKCSSKTVANAWLFVSGVIADAAGTRFDVRVGQVVSKERAFLDADQIKSFLEIIKGTEVEIAALLALSSLRRSEIQGLDWGCVDMEKRLIYIKQSAVYDEHGDLVTKTETKNKGSRRTVPMIEPLYQALNAVEDRTGRVVPMTGNAASKRINVICENNGLPSVGLHGLRHSFASLSYSLNVPAKIAAEIGGWSGDATMQKIYTHIAQKDREHYTSAFTAFFENAHENAHEIKNS